MVPHAVLNVRVLGFVSPVRRKVSIVFLSISWQLAVGRVVGGIFSAISVEVGSLIPYYQVKKAPKY